MLVVEVRCRAWRVRAVIEQRARGAESCFLRSCSAEGFSTRHPTIDLVLRRNRRARTSSAYLHFAIPRPSSQRAPISSWKSGRVVLGVGDMPPTSRRGHARFAQMKNRTMFAKPVDVSDAPRRVAGRRWEGKLAILPLIAHNSTTRINAANGMQHRACKVVHTRLLPTTHNSHRRRSAHPRTLLAVTKPCLAPKICLGEYAELRTRSRYCIWIRRGVVRAP